MHCDIDLNLTHQEVDPSLFEPIDYNQIPKLFLGFIIKNNFEFNALQCNDIVKDRAHLCGFEGQIEPVYLRGIFMDPSPAVEKIIEKLEQIISIDVNIIFNQYIQILNQFNLSCNNTYAYLMDGIYPIDIIHLNKVTQNKDNQPKSYVEYASEILHEDKVPWFFTPELKLLILTKSNTYILKNT
tara:strand:+ start:464 stop:1015 length:552 start_codon:yes stop_codon:yes gene_type:complete